MLRKTRVNRVSFTPSMSPSRVQLFKNERSREAYEKLNSKRKIWAERFVILDEFAKIASESCRERVW